MIKILKETFKATPLSIFLMKKLCIQLKLTILVIFYIHNKKPEIQLIKNRIIQG